MNKYKKKKVKKPKLMKFKMKYEKEKKKCQWKRTIESLNLLGPVGVCIIYICMLNLVLIMFIS